MDSVNVTVKFEVRTLLTTFTRSWNNSGYLKTLAVPGYAVHGHPRSLISVPIESVCDFLLVRHSNLGPMLHRFGDIAFLCSLSDSTPIPP